MVLQRDRFLRTVFVEAFIAKNTMVHRTYVGYVVFRKGEAIFCLVEGCYLEMIEVVNKMECSHVHFIYI